MSTKVKVPADVQIISSPHATENVAEQFHLPFQTSSLEIPQRAGSEYYDQLLWRLRQPIEDAQGVGFLLGLTSCNDRTESSTLAVNLAIRAADQHLTPALLVDANRSGTRLHKLVQKTGRDGLAEVLAGRLPLEECVQTTGAPGLELLPLGSAELWDHTPLVQQPFEGFLQELRERYCLVVVNLPTAGAMNHTLPLAAALDAALLVLRSERVDRRTAQAAMKGLTSDGVQLVGAVLTDQHSYVPRWLQRWL